MRSEIRAIRDEDVAAVTAILDGAYGPAPGRVERVRRYRSLGKETWLLALEDGTPAGMAGALDFGAYAYVGLVGVLPSMQRRGIALSLMRALMDISAARGVRTLLLDASDAGAPLYRKLGFVDDDSVRLFVKTSHTPLARAGARPMAREDLPGVAELDRIATGADRARLLDLYFDEAPERAFVVPDPGGRARGFAFAQGYAVGPWAADDAESAELALVAALSCEFPGGLTVAAPCANLAVGGLLEPRGFAATRVLAHMRYGPLVERRRETIYGQASLAAG